MWRDGITDGNECDTCGGCVWGTGVTSLVSQVVAGGASVDDQSIQYDQLCTFKNSGTVGLGYNEASATLNTTIFVDPSFLTVVLTNRGEGTAVGSSLSSLFLTGAGGGGEVETKNLFCFAALLRRGWAGGTQQHQQHVSSALFAVPLHMR